MVDGARVRTHGALRDFRQQWDLARQSWDDAASRAFAERYLEPLEEAIRVALPAMEKMAETLHRMQHDCRDPS